MKVIVTEKEQTTCDIQEINGTTHITIVDKIEVDSLDFWQRVSVVLFLNNKSQYEVCKQLCINQNNFPQRCQTDKLTFEERQQIADALGCKLIVKFVFDDGAEYTANNDARPFVVDACNHADIKLKELSERLGTSRQALNSKLNNGKFTNAELVEIASKIGCAYYSYFELEDGTRI